MLALEAADLERPRRRPRLARLRGGGDRRAAERRRRRPARGGDARAAGRSGFSARRPLASRAASAALRQRHRSRRRGAAARRRAAAPHGVRPSLWRDLRPGLAQRARALSATKRTGKVLNDDRADWREAWALFPGEVAYVWHGALHATTVADSLVACGFAIRSPDHLGQGAAGALPRRLPLAARAVLVRGAREGQGALVRRPQADRRSGRSRAATRTLRPCTAPRSRSRRCAGRC